jgi:hypothetical protein
MIANNTLAIKLRLFDLEHEISLEFGKYDSLPLNDAKVEFIMKDIHQTFHKASKQFETALTNLKKGV